MKTGRSEVGERITPWSRMIRTLPHKKPDVCSRMWVLSTSAWGTGTPWPLRTMAAFGPGGIIMMGNWAQAASMNQITPHDGHLYLSLKLVLKQTGRTFRLRPPFPMDLNLMEPLCAGANCPCLKVSVPPKIPGRTSNH